MSAFFPCDFLMVKRDVYLYPPRNGFVCSGSMVLFLSSRVHIKNNNLDDVIVEVEFVHGKNWVKTYLFEKELARTFEKIGSDK